MKKKKFYLQAVDLVVGSVLTAGFFVLSFLAMAYNEHMPYGGKAQQVLIGIIKVMAKR